MVQKYEAGREFPELLIANYDLYERERAKPRQLSLLDMQTDYDKNLDKILDKILKESIISWKMKQ